MAYVMVREQLRWGASATVPAALHANAPPAEPHLIVLVAVMGWYAISVVCALRADHVVDLLLLDRSARHAEQTTFGRAPTAPPSPLLRAVRAPSDVAKVAAPRQRPSPSRPIWQVTVFMACSRFVDGVRARHAVSSGAAEAFLFA